MVGVHYEVGGCGTMQIVTKDIIFGWVYIDGMRDNETYLMKTIREEAKEMFDDIISRVSADVREEILEATKPEDKPAPLPEPKVVPVEKETEDRLVIPRGFEKDLDDECVKKVLKDWGTKDDSSGEFSKFCLDVYAHPTPAAELLRIRKERDEGCGWVLDIICCAWVNKHKDTE